MTGTDLVRYEPRQSSLELAGQAWKLAEKIANTDFVPRALRGKPEAVLACILAGHEAGVPAMASLAKIHIIEGRPAMAAELMRALVLEHGHSLEFEAVSNTAVTAVGKRRSSTRETKVTWTIDDARAAGVLGKDNWRKYPRAMLIARATAELCRMIFPDVLAGISHTVEELTDGDLLSTHELGLPPVAAPPAPPTRARAERAITGGAQPVDDPAPAPQATRGDVPDLPPGPDELPPITDAEIVDDEPTSGSDTLGASGETGNPGPGDEDWPSGDWPSGDDTGPTDVKRYTGPQIIAIKLHHLFGITGSSPEARQARLDAIAVLIGRPIGSSNDLTPEETSSLIARLDQWPEGQPLPIPGTESEADAGSAPPPPATAEAEPTSTEPASPPRPPRVRPHSTPLEEWDADKWRATLRDRGVKVTEAMREAQRLGAALTPPATIGTLDDVAGSGIAADLLGYVEDLSLERKAAGK